MRVSGIEKFLGGADNVNSIDVIRGEQINFEGTVKDQDGDAMDIENFIISAVAEYYNADVSIRGSNMTVTNFQPNSKADKTLTVTKNSDSATGKFTVTVPADLADDADTADLDATSQVLMAVIYLTYNDGGTPATIRKSRVLVSVRHSG